MNDIPKAEEELSVYLRENVGLSGKFIKCPLYCPPTCLIQHHPLLVTILNCIDTPEIKLMEKKLQILSGLVNRYTQGEYWSGNDPIPEVVERYRAPMLHWVAILGRVGAAVWLIGHNISDPTTKSSVYNGETALHRALLCLQETCPTEPGHKFVQLLSVLEPALSIPDNNGNTPLHVCCAKLKTGLHKTEYYKECLHYMLYELNNEKKMARHDIQTVLNMKNASGDTALHLLSTNDKHLSEIKFLVRFGADFTIENNAKQTPYDLAKAHHCSVVCTLFEMWLSGSGLTEAIHVNPPGQKTRSRSETIQQTQQTEDKSDQRANDHPDDVPPTKRPKTSEVGDDCQDTELRMLLLSGEEQLITVPCLFSDSKDSSAQAYFEQAVIKYYNFLKSKKQSRKTKLSSSDFIMLASTLESTSKADKEALRKTLIETDPDVVCRYIDYIKDIGNRCEPIIDFIVKSRDEALAKLKLSAKCEASIQKLFKEKQEKQESLVAEIMKEYDSLPKLNKEEQLLNTEMESIDEQLSAAKKTNDLLKEQLSNCEQAIDVLKQVYCEGISKKPGS